MTERSCHNRRLAAGFRRKIIAFYPSRVGFLLLCFACLSSPFLAADQQPPDPLNGPAPSSFRRIADTLSGYYKMLSIFTKSKDTKEGLYSFLQRLRLEFKPKVTKHIELNIAYDHELLFHDFAHTLDFGLIRQKNQRGLSWMDADKVLGDTDHFYERHLLHRFYLKFESPRSRWIFGKQLVDWGRLRFFSPLDLFNQPIPSDIEPDERIGFDALSMEFMGNGFCGVQLLYGPASNPARDSYGARFYKKLKTYDLFLIAARHEKDRVAGLGFDGYLAGAGLRGEFTYTEAGSERYARAGLGVDHSFSERSNILVEYFYNGAANGDFMAFSDSLLESRKRLSLKKHLLSIMMSHDITPLLKFTGTGIYDAAGKNAFLKPEVRYNIQQNLDISVGAHLFVKSLGGEFEDRRNLYYLELKLFF